MTSVHGSSSIGRATDALPIYPELERKFTAPHLLWQIEDEPPIQSLIPHIVSKVVPSLHSGASHLDAELQTLVNFAHNAKLRALIFSSV